MTNRYAFTLIEVMIVLTIVVSVMAIAWPRMRGLAAKTQIREAAIEFKAACIEARDSAVRSGNPVYVRYKFGQSKFRLTDSDTTDTDSQTVIQVNPSLSTEPNIGQDGPWSQEVQLASGMVFDDPNNQHRESLDKPGTSAVVVPDHGANSEQLDVKDTLAVGEKKLVDWTESEQIVFFPEGRSTTAIVRLLATDNGDSITLTIRGLTAGITIGAVEKSLEKPVQDRVSDPPRQGYSSPSTGTVGRGSDRASLQHLPRPSIATLQAGT